MTIFVLEDGGAGVAEVTTRRTMVGFSLPCAANSGACSVVVASVVNGIPVGFNWTLANVGRGIGVGDMGDSSALRNRAC